MDSLLTTAKYHHLFAIRRYFLWRSPAKYVVNKSHGVIIKTNRLPKVLPVTDLVEGDRSSSGPLS